jgi:hypothetical protein
MYLKPGMSMRTKYEWESRDFLKRLDKTAVKTSRYVWHITHNSYSLNWQIAVEGLFCPRNYAVFAHNNIDHFAGTFPYFLDWDLFEREDRISSAHFRNYSFWRIDTRLADLVWYADPNMVQDTKALCLGENSFVCALQSVPNYALKLFQHDPNRFVNRNSVISKGDGVTSVRGIGTDFDSLRPHIKINSYIQYCAQKNPNFLKHQYGF